MITERYPNVDTYLDKTNPLTGFGGSTAHIDLSLTSAGNQDQHPALSFNISDLPETPTSVELRLTTISSQSLTGRNLVIYGLIEDESDFSDGIGLNEEANWTNCKEGQAWDVAGGGSSPVSTLTFDPTLLASGTNFLDITSLYNAIKTLGYSILGLILVLTGSSIGTPNIVFEAGPVSDSVKPMLLVTSPDPPAARKGFKIFDP